MINEDAQSVKEVLDKVTSIARNWYTTPTTSSELWFRGQSKARYNLLPGLYRPTSAIFNYDEDDLFERFKARGSAYADEKIKSEWDWYYLSQHHGLPTRLLDWTENLLAAIYFSIREIFETGDRRRYDTDLYLPPATAIYDDDSPAVWILDPGSLNQHTCGPSEDYVIAPGGSVTEQYLPSNIANKSPSNRYPLAILPPHTNIRISSQLCVFTVHGHDTQSIDVLASSPGSLIKLAKLKLDRANIAKVWDQLELSGINRVAMFPDLDAVAYCTKWNRQQP
ncbi:FRG domain-containing protein [Candidatus Bathyarchaeota archaeon]|nr:FRG domain-containing protein [Candidatus Bathyarchaeota archaeon]